MKKISITVFALLLSLLVLNVYADQVKQAQEAGKEKEMALLDLFNTKCTKCHDAKSAQMIHEIETGDKPSDIVKTMQRRRNSDMSLRDADRISKFLDGPTLELLETECSKCHNPYRILAACRAGNISKETIKEMQKKGATVTDEQIDIIYDAVK
jgi:hypothetical protein